MREVERKTMQLPKNFRQVGEPRLNKKIYIEDYVVTYLTELAQPKNIYARGAILLGTIENTKEGQAIFIKGALEAQNLELDLDETIFSNEIWAEIKERIKKYFPDLKIVGWFLSRIGFSVELNDKIVRTHIENFPGENKILYMMDTLEEEEAFYVWEKGELKKSGGYYIYYEKNEKMQEYMVMQGEENKKKTSENKEIPIIKRDENVIKTYRNRIKSKKKEKKNEKTKGKLYAAVGSCAAFALILGFLLFSRGGGEKNAVANVAEILQEPSNINSIEETWNEESIKSNKTFNQESSNSETSEQEVTTAANEEEEQLASTEINDTSRIKTTSSQSTNSISASEAGKNSTDPVESSEEKNSGTEDNLEEKSQDSLEESLSNVASNIEQEIQSDIEPDIAKNGESEETMGIVASYYTVQPGDTLASISNQVYHSLDYVEEIAQLNELKDLNKIYPGQKLQLPQKE